MTTNGTVTNYQDLAPDSLIIDANARTEAKATLTKEFIESVRTLGVVLPILCVQETPAGPVRVRDGQRRVLAAIDAGVGSVPGLVITGPGADDAAARLQTQLAAGLFQERLSTADTIAATAALFDLGAPAATVKAATGLGRKAQGQVKAVAKSEDAMGAVREHAALTLDEAAAIAEFDDDPDIKQRLLSHAGRNSFPYVAERARQDRKDAAEYDKAKTAAEADGFQVVPYEQSGGELYRFTDGDGNPLTDETHADCPGKAVQIAGAGGLVAYCTRPELHQLKAGVSAPKRQPGEPMSQAQKDERKQVIHNNKWWRAATQVRANWLAEFAKAKKAPDGCLAWVLECVARADYEMHKMARGYCLPGLAALGIDPNAKEDNRERDAYSAAPGGKTTAIARITANGGASQRSLVAAATLLLGAYESDLSPDDGWRSVTPARQRYMARLEAWGYPVSEVERCLLDGRLDRWVHHPDGEVTFLKSDEQVAAEQKRAAEREAELAAYLDRSRADAGYHDARAAGGQDGPAQVMPDSQTPGSTTDTTPGDDEWPRTVAGRLVDRPANPVTDLEEEILEADGAAWHLAPGELDGDAEG